MPKVRSRLGKAIPFLGNSKHVIVKTNVHFGEILYKLRIPLKKTQLYENTTNCSESNTCADDYSNANTDNG